MFEISLSGEKIFQAFGISFSNTFLLTMLLSLALFLPFLMFFQKARIIPGRLQNFLEWILETFYNFVESITGSPSRAREIFPIAVTLFILILASNLLELIPGVGVFHFLRSPSSDLNFTLALAIFSMLYINFLTIKNLRIWVYRKRFLNLKNPLTFFIGLLEGISELSRILSLSFRLFGNLFAGEVLLIVTSFLFAYLFPLPFLALEILVGVVQAFIFSALIVIFYVSSIELAHGH